MIKEIILYFFEIHRKTRLVFSRKVNCIIGSSDEGKSSIRKALNLVKNNRPSGIGYKNRRAKSRTTKSIVLVDEGRIERIRGKLKNYYRVNGGKLNAVGQKVPKEVSKMLNMGDINIQNQFDTFFLLQDSPGKVAKKFNEFVGLGIIDDVAKEAEITVRKYNKDVGKFETECSDLKSELHDYKETDLIGSLIKKANQKEEKIKRYRKDTDKINNLLSDLYYNQKIMTSLPSMGVFKVLLSRLDRRFKKIVKYEEDITKISSLLMDHNELQNELTILRNKSEIEDLLSQAGAKQLQRELDSKALYEISEHLSTFERQTLLRIQISHDLKQTAQEIEVLHKKMKVCPTCNRKWK